MVLATSCVKRSMANNRKHFANPTPPKRCDAKDMPESGPEVPVVCRKKVFKAGMCIRHYNEWRNARILRGETVTRRRRFTDDGGVWYSTSAIDKAEDGQCFRTDRNWCNIISCRRPGQIVMEKVVWCMVHFQKDQVKRQRIEAKEKAA